MDEEQITLIVATAIGVTLMIAGHYGLNRLQLNVGARAILGVAMLLAGFALVYPLIFGAGDLVQSPVRFGVCVALIGLGINQAASPIRAALGRAP
jgi:hypothetical protein